MKSAELDGMSDYKHTHLLFLPGSFLPLGHYALHISLHDLCVACRFSVKNYKILLQSFVHLEISGRHMLVRIFSPTWQLAGLWCVFICIWPHDSNNVMRPFAVMVSNGEG